MSGSPPFRLVRPVAALAVVILLGGCSQLGARPSTPLLTPEPSPIATTPAPTSPPEVPSTPDRTATPSPDESATPTPTPDREAESYARAQAALEHWDGVVDQTGPDPIVFTSPLSRGGGWRGPNGGDQKGAFLCGLVRPVGELPGEPPPGEIVWQDGTKRTVQLVSAESAVEDVGEHSDAGSCGGYRPLEVTGARLVTREIATTRGPAVLPVWRFAFTDRDKPVQPISHVALDKSEYITLEDWPELDSAVNTEWAVGRPESSELTVAFIGSAPGDGPCTADYTGEAVESDTGVVVIVTGHSDLPSPRPTGPIFCNLVGYTRTVTVSLSEPLGSRTVLDHWSGWPVALYPEMPEGYPSI